MINTLAKHSDDITLLEQENKKVAYYAATESIVLLKNEKVLPTNNKKIALFGEGAMNTYKGGTGSGDVNCRNFINLKDAFIKEGYEIVNMSYLQQYEQEIKDAKKEHVLNAFKNNKFKTTTEDMLLLGFQPPFAKEIEDEDIDTSTDTCIYVISRQAGEGADRKLKKGEYYLTDTEIENISICVKNYPKFTLVINTGCIIELSKLMSLNIPSIIYMCQQGMEGCKALIDIINGTVNPSGHLVDSWPIKYEHIPYAYEYSFLNDNLQQEFYKEDIYVGYRYYDTFNVPVLYPFGYGLTYSKFTITSKASIEGRTITVTSDVTNTSKIAGKEVVQVYVSCPQGKLKKEYQRLVAFGKTPLLKGKENKELNISFDIATLASFDEDIHQYILEEGDYIIRVGNNSLKTTPIAKIRIEETIVLSQHKEICPLQGQFETLSSNIENETHKSLPILEFDSSLIKKVTNTYPTILCKEVSIPKINKKSDIMKSNFVMGGGLDIYSPKKYKFNVPGAAAYSTSKFEKYGVPAMSFVDGPAGLRLAKCVYIKGNKIKYLSSIHESFNYLPEKDQKRCFKSTYNTSYFQYATAFPVGTSLAMTWNEAMVEDVGRAVGKEMEDLGVIYWLAPGMNIHRNPLCGRNFEYYSEDPLLTGKIAAAIIRGVQSRKGRYVTIKHFCCNNQESNRMHVSENVTERALREIYLKGFEIAIADAKPKALMTSYNKVNGVHSAENYDLLIDVLRNEWKYDGLVMTDWVCEDNQSNIVKSINAGVNICMPGMEFDKKRIIKGLKDKQVDLDLFYYSINKIIEQSSDTFLAPKKENEDM